MFLLNGPKGTTNGTPGNHKKGTVKYFVLSATQNEPILSDWREFSEP